MEIKESVQHLCRCLVQLGFSYIEPEVFRQGKFNCDDAAPALWRLLGELVFCLQKGKADVPKKIEVEKILNDRSKLKEIRDAVINLGYLTPDFSNFQNSNINSRELLLAIGWIMAMYKPLDFLTESFIVASSTSREDSSSFLKEMQDSEGSPSHSPTHVSDTDMTHQLIWYLGHLHLSLKVLLSAQHKRLKLLNEIHQKTKGIYLSPDSPHLSMLQATTICQDKLFSKHIEHLETENNILTSYLHWKEGESLFWQWMGSIADLKRKEQLSERNNNISPEIKRSNYQESVQKISSQINNVDYLQEHRSPFNGHCGLRFVHHAEKYSETKHSPNHEKMCSIQKELENYLVRIKKELLCNQVECKTVLEGFFSECSELTCIPP